MSRCVPYVWTLVVLALLAVLASAWVDSIISLQDVARATRTASTCAEDEACWSCATMGNLRCGPQ